ncbi:TPA: hypothetical protein NV714_003525 [Escherichia coli]|nr:hypothetical protein [Escherichia coli]
MEIKMIDSNLIKKIPKILSEIEVKDNKKSIEMIEALDKEDFYKAIELLQSGSEPNIAVYDGSREEFVTVIQVLFDKLYETESKVSFFKDYIDLNPDEDDLALTENKHLKAPYEEISLFIKEWKKYGGSLNANLIKIKKDECSEIKNSEIKTMSDSIFNLLFICTEKQNWNNYYSSAYLYDPMIILRSLSDIMNEKLKPVFLDKPVLSLVLKECWPLYTTLDFLEILNQEHDEFLINKRQGETVLHTLVDLRKENNYCLVKYSNPDYIKFINETIENINKIYPPELLLIKNKEGLLPVELFAKKESWSQFIIMDSLMKKNNYKYELTQEMIDLFPEDLTTLGMIRENLTEEKLKEMFAEIYTLKEKSVLNKEISEDKEVKIQKNNRL